MKRKSFREKGSICSLQTFSFTRAFLKYGKIMITYKGPIWVPYGLKFLYVTHMGPIWASCPDSAHMGPIFPCETFQLLNGKGINAEFPSNKPNRIKKLFPCCSSRKHRVDHRYTCDFLFIITLYWSFSDLPVASSRTSRVLARCKVILRLFYLTEQVGMLNLKSERKKKNEE